MGRCAWNALMMTFCGLRMKVSWSTHHLRNIFYMWWGHRKECWKRKSSKEIVPSCLHPWSNERGFRWPMTLLCPCSATVVLSLLLKTEQDLWGIWLLRKAGRIRTSNAHNCSEPEFLPTFSIFASLHTLLHTVYVII